MPEIQEIDVCKLSFVMAVKDAVGVTNGKWKLAIVCALLRSDYRFSDLERLLGSVTPRMLARDLKELELSGVIERHTLQEGGRTVTLYGLTDSGKDLETVIVEMASWGERHRERVRSAPPVPCPMIVDAEH